MNTTVHATSRVRHVMKEATVNIFPYISKRGLGILFVAVGLLAGACACAPAPTTEAIPTQPSEGTPPVLAPTATTEAVPTEAAPSPNEIFRVATNRDPGQWDPHKVVSGDLFWCRNLYEPLVDVKTGTWEVEGVLAESWTISDDGRTYTFKLRDGVTFNDGTPLTAEAVESTFDRLKEVGLGPVYVLDPVESYEATDADTFAITLKQPFGPFLYTLKLVYIVSPVAVEEHDVDGDLAQAWLNEHSAGTGPYMLKEVDPGIQFVLERFEGYWKGWEGKHFREVQTLIVMEEGTARLMLENQDVDLSEIYPLEALPAFRENPDINVVEYETVGTWVWMLNTNCGPTSDQRVRAAISHAWDQASWEDVVGEMGRLTTPVPPSFVGGYEPDNPYAGLDLDKARALLEEAGYPGGGFSLRFQTYPNVKAVRAGEILQAKLKEIGIDLSVEELALPTFLERAGSAETQTDPEQCMHMWLLMNNPRYPDAHWFLHRTYHSDAYLGTGFNKLRYSNPEVDAAIEAGDAELEPDQRNVHYRKAIDLIIDDVASVYCGYQVARWPMLESVKGYEPRPELGELGLLPNLYSMWKE